MTTIPRGPEDGGRDLMQALPCEMNIVASFRFKEVKIED
jgi:hypothetical protein